MEVRVKMTILQGLAKLLAIVSVGSILSAAAQEAIVDTTAPLVEYRRQGGLLPVTQDWVLADDGRLIRADGVAHHMPASAVTRVREGCDSIRPGDITVTDPACADCYTTEVRLRCADGVRRIIVTEGSPLVPAPIAELLAGIRSGIRASRRVE